MGKGKILVLGGTGAMGVYVVPELIEMGYHLDVVALGDIQPDSRQLCYIKENGKDINVLKKNLKNNYDAIIDFLTYTTAEFLERHKLLLENTKHYIFLSSYRVYADVDRVITENSPRVIASIKNKDFVLSDDYAITKCRQENILENSKYLNWSIVRPSIVYSKRRFQLVALEAQMFIPRAFKNKKIVLPREAMDVQATMTWAGDIAKMMSRLVLNPRAYREKYTLSTAEHNPWRFVRDCYEKFIDLQVEEVDYDTYVKIRAGGPWDIKPVMWQLDYDRLFNRIIDNSKILSVTGLKQSDFTTLKKGLEKELTALPRDWNWNETKDISLRMDKFLRGETL